MGAFARCALFCAISAIAAHWGSSTAVAQVRRANYLPKPSDAKPQLPDKKVLERHPLTPALRYARKRYAVIQGELRDYTCVLVKRELFDGQLRDYQYLATKTRHEVKQDGRVVRPFSVFVEYLGPEDVKGRKALFIAGQNDGKVLVRRGGKRFGYVTVKVIPDSDVALRESHYPITEIGIVNIVMRLIEQIEDDMRFDPNGVNTKVEYFTGAKVAGRPCSRYHIVHPVQATGLDFHIANVYIDEEYELPIRIEAYDWPEDEGGQPVLMEEYTYTQLKLNVGLSDADFTESRLR